jgi:glucosamine-6-phosphate deaminase
MTEVRVFTDADALGAALADEIVVGIDTARGAGRQFVLGCPGGRSARSTYQALAKRVAGADLSHLIIAMMDDYVVPTGDGGFEHVPADAHYSCRYFARQEIARPLDRMAAIGIAPDHVWLPDPTDPPSYRHRLEAAGGVDHFIVASGASDGHVAFVKPGTPLDSDVSIISLAETTRRDNLATFPAFGSIDEVPSYGVSVGLGTIIDLSRRVTLVMHGGGKRVTARRVLRASDFEPDWPATFIHRCRDARIWLDSAAHQGGEEEVVQASKPDDQ